MNNVLFAVIVLGAMGIVFGLILAIASKVFAVEVDERQEALIEVLPGANCGGCGYAGCSAYAVAIVAGSAPLTACAAGGKETAEKMAEIMGVAAGEMERCVAFVKCSGSTGVAKMNFEYSGIPDCLAAMRLGGGRGPSECAQSCLGMGNCVRACTFDAIEIIDGVAKVNKERCTGCMACATACPKNIVAKVPYESEVFVACSSPQKGAAVRKFCETGCIACKLCEKACQHDAVHVVDNLAVIDYAKCTGCGDCVQKCSRNTIQVEKSKVKSVKSA